MSWLFRFLQRTLSKLLDDCDDFLDRNNHMDLSIMGEYDEGDGEHHAGEQGRCDLVGCSLFDAIRVGNSGVSD